MSQRTLEAIKVETGPSPHASVIWMHGLGADYNDFVPIVQELDLAGAPDIRFIFPNAPMQPVSINNGAVMRAWYDVKWGDLEGRGKQADETGVRASQAAIGQLIEHEIAAGIQPENIVIAGFSQGGAVALQTGLRYPQKLAGVMALSTYLPLAESFEQEATPQNRTTPVFMAHGTHDPVVAYPLAVQSKDILLVNGYRVEWHEYPMQHSVCLEELTDIATWLKAALT